MTAPFPAAPLPTTVLRPAPAGASDGPRDDLVVAALAELRALPDPARAVEPAAALAEDARALGGVHDALRARLDATAS